MKVDFKRICRAIVGGLILKAVIDKIDDGVCATNNNSSVVNYGTAVEAIMCSDMFDHYKQDAIKLLKPDKDQSYYKAVISIIDSDMFDYRKVETIKEISQN